VSGRWPLLALAALALWVIARSLQGAASERLRSLPVELHAFTVRDGVLLVTARDSIGLTGVVATGGASRVLVPPSRTTGTASGTFLTPSGAVFRMEETATPSAPGSPWAMFGLGPAGSRTRLWAASLDGTPARELLPELRMERAVPSGDTCFWLRKTGPDRSIAAPWQRPRSLVATPLTGGRSRELARGLNALTLLEPLGGGVSWSVPRRDLRHSDRYLALPPEFEVAVVRDCFGQPELVNDRLYWLHYVPTPFSQGRVQPAQLELTSAATDGSDRRVLLNLLGHPEWQPRARLLGGHGGLVYWLLYPQGRRNEMVLPKLCAVSEAGIRPVARLRAEVISTWLDGGYLYYTVEERRENWLDWSAAGLQHQRAVVLYRTHLTG
jgi:hypothetical protein